VSTNRFHPVFWLGLVLTGACGFDPNGLGGGNRTPTGVTGTGAATGIGPATGSGGSGGVSTPGGRCSNWSDPDRVACGGDLYQGQGLPLDIHVMFDVSGSMATMDDGVTMRIDAVRGALGQFLADPDSVGLRVGIGYFGTQPLSCACTSCNPSDYATPAVALGELPGAAAKLTDSLAKQAPTGETPTGAALRGACSYAGAAKQANPGRDVVVLLVTDGIPQAPLSSQMGGCNPTLADANAAATECRSGAASIRTYVLGVGPSLANLNQIAVAGGTGHAYLVESGGAGAVLDALNAIRRDARIPCSLEIPKAPNGLSTVNLATVNVVYADASCKLTTFVNVKTAAGCDPQRGGWYYDDPARPTSIELCDASCAAVGAPGGELRVSVGCSTITIGAITR
jgi:hypothetical protein